MLDYTDLIGNYTGGGGRGGSLTPPGPGCGDGGNSGDGGGIYNGGLLWLKDSLLTSNYVQSGGDGGLLENIYNSGRCPGGQGGSGGGVYNTGHMQVEQTFISWNWAGGGGSFWGAGGGGGGIYNTGQLDIDNSQVTGNGSGGGNLEGGQGGSGGGIYSNGQADISFSLIEGNHTGGGGSGFCNAKEGYSPGGGGWGGGIFNDGGLSVDNTPIRGNTTGPGGSYDYGPLCDGGGPGGSGGGLANNGTAELWSSSVVGNIAGNGGEALEDGRGGVGGSGGGIYNSSGFSIEYSPVMSNTAGRGGAPGGQGGSGGGIVNTGWVDLLGGTVNRNKSGPGASPDNQDGNGGGIDSGQGTLTLTNAIVTENFLEPGGMGGGLYVGSTATLVHTTLARNTGGDGSGIYFYGGSLTLTNTILVSQTVGINTSGDSVHLDSTLWGSGAWANISDWGGSGSHTSIHDYHVIPGFVDPENGDYHILSTSAAVDLGVQTATTVDIDNQQRPNPSTGIPSTGIPDLGADEYWLFTPISEVSITGPSLIFTSLEATFTAIISPTEAIPNITYYWSPEPKIRQGTDTVNYNILFPGTYTITVTAYNAGSTVTATFPVSVVFGPYCLFLPLIGNKGGGE